MFRISGLLMMAFAVFLGGLLFWTSQSVQRAEEELAKINQTLTAEEDSLRVLTTEWSYLNRPDRLEKLAQETLEIETDNPKDAPFIIEGMEEIPEPMVPAIPQAKPVRYDVPVENEGAKDE